MMSDDLDFSRRHGAKTIIPTGESVTLHPYCHTTNTSQNGQEPLCEHKPSRHENVEEGGNGLDTPLSALQKSAFKTALLINKQPIIHYISIEEDLEEDCFSRHWIFRRRVGFDADQQNGARAADVKRVLAHDHSQQYSAEACNVEHLKARQNLLNRQLQSIQHKRRHLQRTHSKLAAVRSEWIYHLSSLQQDRILVSSTLQSLKQQKVLNLLEYSTAQRWHVLGDAFFIWHNGPFATINGNRLGRSAKTAFSQKKGGPDAKQLFSWGSETQRQTISTSVTVPFHEINSAIGQVVLLLYTLQNTPNSGISFQKHVLQPCGHASKIGFLKNAKPPTSTRQQQLQHTHYGERRRIFATHDEITWYNLHHYEENGSYLSMGYYSRRNFNFALEGLVYCIAEACLVSERRDMALSVPYNISCGGLNAGKDKERSDGTTIGGLPVQYDPEEGERWTMVCRYLLTDLKWLVAYIAKHVDT